MPWSELPLSSVGHGVRTVWVRGAVLRQVRVVGRAGLRRRVGTWRDTRPRRGGTALTFAAVDLVAVNLVAVNLVAVDLVAVNLVAVDLVAVE